MHTSNFCAGLISQNKINYFTFCHPCLEDFEAVIILKAPRWQIHMSFIAFNPCNYLAGLVSLFPFLQIKEWVLERLSNRLILMYLVWSEARLWPCICPISRPLISSVHQADFPNKLHLLNINFSDMHMQYSSLFSLKTQIWSQAVTLDL